MPSQQQHLQQISADEEKILVERALDAQKNAYCPYSNFPVGAALLTETGEIFMGANVENVSYGGTICAERSAICAAVSALGAPNFRPKAVAVVCDMLEPTSPCGMCRQVLAEFGNYPILLYSRPSQKLMVVSVHELLPMAFTPDHLEQFNKANGGGNAGNKEQQQPQQQLDTEDWIDEWPFFVVNETQ